MKGSNPNQYVEYRQSGYGFQQPYYSTGATGPTPPMGAQPIQQMTPTFAPTPTFATTPTGGQNIAANIPGMLPIEQSYIENILRLNKGKLATVFATFDGDKKVFKGLIEAAGRDHLILSDPQTGMRYLIPMVFFNYAQFDEELEYEYPFGTQPGMASFPPR